MNNSLVELFVAVDDFWQAVRPQWHQYLLSSGKRQRIRSTELSESEMMTILVLFHQSNYRHFKAFYVKHVSVYLRDEFPSLVSYPRFVALQPRVGVLLYMFLVLQFGRCTGISYVDSTPLRVCHNRRISSHRVFDGLAARGKSSTGWFYGFKLHLVINHLGEIIAFDLTPANVNDRKPLQHLVRDIFGKLFGDKGYLSQSLADELREKGIGLITSIRRNMKPQLLTLYDKLLLKRRSIIETINDQLKNIAYIEHSRHRSPNNFFVNLVSGLIAYCFQPNKPSVQLDPHDYLALATIQP